MPAQLVALSGGPSILLDKPILLLGRHPECDIQIDSRKISRRHCCIAQISDYLLIRDLGSTNGVRVNGVRVLEGRLKPGDEVTIGNHRYEVEWDLGGVGELASPLFERGDSAGPPALQSQPKHQQDVRAARKVEHPARDMGGPAKENFDSGAYSPEDEMLEECDEPVALPDPSNLAQALPPAGFGSLQSRPQAPSGHQESLAQGAQPPRGPAIEDEPFPEDESSDVPTPPPHEEFAGSSEAGKAEISKQSGQEPDENVSPSRSEEGDRGEEESDPLILPDDLDLVPNSKDGLPAVDIRPPAPPPSGNSLDACSSPSSGGQLPPDASPEGSHPPQGG